MMRTTLLIVGGLFCVSAAILDACTSAQIAQVTSVQQQIQAACNVVLPLASDPALVALGAGVPVVAQVAAAAVAGCGTAEGLAALAASPTSAVWLSTVQTVLQSHGTILPPSP